ncbi:MAG: GNAT family N-acetyltransferase [Acidimicrobiales bacterium]
MSDAVATVEAAAEVTDELVAEIALLVPQLSDTARAPGKCELEEIVFSPGTSLLLARATGSRRLLGMLTLVTHQIPTGRRAVIEDVVVDRGSRGLGIGELLVTAALEGAAGYGARSVDLTSRPSREEANGLYTKLGFEQRMTNHYRYVLATREN